MTAAIYTTPATTAMTAFTATLNGGTIAIYTGAQPAANAAITGTQIVTMALSATALHAVNVADCAGKPTLVVGHGVLGRLVARLLVAHPLFRRRALRRQRRIHLVPHVDRRLTEHPGVLTADKFPANALERTFGALLLRLDDVLRSRVRERFGRRLKRLLALLVIIERCLLLRRQRMLL